MTQGNNPKFCDQCGHRLRETPKFCPECGVSIYNASEKTDSYSLHEHVGDISLFQKTLTKTLFVFDALVGYRLSDFTERAGIPKVLTIVVMVVLISFMVGVCYWWIIEFPKLLFEDW
tara:strand:- start:133 stop:483 length:351 start_codon:yes stop_codon:yes gene_type:complete